MTIWPSDDKRTGVYRQINELLKGFSRPLPSGSGSGPDQAWLDAGQHATLAALQNRLCERGLPGAIIADEVGMGKTRIAVALACAVVCAGGRVVVAVPPGLLHQWREEFRKTFLAAKEDPPEIPEIRSLRDLYSDDSRSLSSAPVLLLPHGLLNFQMKNGWGSQRLRTQYQDHIAGRERFSRMIPADEKQIISDHVGRLANGHALQPEELQSRGTGREAFISFTLSLLGGFDLVIIDEAHKSKDDASAERENAHRSTLAQLLMRLVRQDRVKNVPPRRLCLTATPFELGPDNWRQILQRAGADDKTANGCAQASEQFLAAAKTVQLLPNPENAEAFRIAAEEFRKQLSPWVLRRRKAVPGNDSVLERYIRDHGPDYRDRSQRITAEVAGKEWSVAMMAVEALSLMPATGLAAQKRLRLALARGFSLASALDAAGKPERGDWRDSDEHTLSDTGRDPVTNQQEDRRRERAGFWMDRLKPAAADPYAHPTLLAAVRAIEEVAIPSEVPEKVLVFGIFTQAMRRLTDLLNAREMIRRLMIFSHNPDAPFKTWHWPGETIPVDAQFREALAAALQMADMRNLVGNADIVTLSGLMQRQYDKYRSQRSRALDEVRIYVTETLGPQIGLAVQKEKLVLPLTQALIEIMDDQERRHGRSTVAEAWDALRKENLPNDEEDEDGASDPAQDLTSRIKLALTDFDGRNGFFARRLAGGMGAAAKQHLQTAFNRRASWPMVLVAQSSVGREGLNLHKSCRTVVLFQPEWNPGVVEQQIGRVDRIGSLWEEMVSQHRGNTEPPKIRILPVELPGSYDEHNWEVLNDRWVSYRAQMNGEVFASAKSRSQPSSAVVAVVRNATPDFSPLPGAPET